LEYEDGAELAEKGFRGGQCRDVRVETIASLRI
jgi:hypothetical protein